MSTARDLLGRRIVLSQTELLLWLNEPGHSAYRYVRYSEVEGFDKIHRWGAYLYDMSSDYPRIPAVRAQTVTALLGRGLIEEVQNDGCAPWAQITDAGRALLAALNGGTADAE